MYTYMQTIRFTYFPFIYEYYAQQPGHMKEDKHSANLKPLSLIPPMLEGKDSLVDVLKYLLAKPYHFG